MKKLIFLLLVLVNSLMLNAQTPTGFNYQAVIRNSSGQVLANQNVSLRVNLISNSGTTTYYTETHGLTTTAQGVVNLIIGEGTDRVGTISQVPWDKEQVKLRVEFKAGQATTYSELGVQALQAVPYALHAANTKEITSNPTATDDEPIFVVRNKEGKIVFAVYQEGVRVYVDDTSVKGAKGGFAVGGLSTQGKAEVEYLKITPDSARIYIDTSSTKGAKGGFAVGGLSTQGKSTSYDIFRVTNDSTRIYIDDRTKGAKGGFAVGGLSTQGKASGINFFDVSTDATGIINPSQKRVVWYPIKNAFLAGKVLIESPDSVGVNSFSSGFESKAVGAYSQAMGYMAIARGHFSTAIGKGAVAKKENSFAFGLEAKANGYGSFALGNKSIAQGIGSFALGFEGPDSLNALTGATLASGDYSIAFGMGAKALKKGSLAIGTLAEANYEYSQSFGYLTKADNWYATAVGYKSRATGKFSSAFGFQAFASGDASVALGKGNAAGALSMAIGDSYAGGIKSFSMGSASVATGHASIAMGFENSAVGEASVALGYATFANGNNSFAAGRGTIANADNSTALGFWNIGVSAGVGLPITNPDYNSILELGNGATPTNLTNAMTVFRNGRVIVGNHNAQFIEDYISIEDEPQHTLVVMGRKPSPTSETFGLYVKGNSSFDGNLLPLSTTSDLGSSTGYWRGIYAKNYYGESGSAIFNASIIPNATGTRNLGSTTFRWNYLYSNKLDVNGTSYFSSSIGVGATNTDTSIPLKLSSSSTSRTALTLENPSSSNVYVIQTVGSAIAARAGNFEIWNTGMSVASLTIASNGNIGIGTTTAPDKKLHVVGDARITGNIYYGLTGTDFYSKPDYVFLSNYTKYHDPLEVEEFIIKKGHLPWVTKADAEKDGINMTRMQFETLETVENLQLQIIAIKKEYQEKINKLEEKVKEYESLKSELEAIKQLIKK